MEIGLKQLSRYTTSQRAILEELGGTMCGNLGSSLPLSRLALPLVELAVKKESPFFQLEPQGWISSVDLAGKESF